MNKYTVYFRNPEKGHALEHETICANGIEDARSIYANAGMLVESVSPAKQLVAVGNAQGVTSFDPGFFTAADEADRQAEINFARYGG